MEIDWGDGRYERTAADLVPAATALVEYADVAPGQHVLDIGCGTGNASLAAASAGARVTGIDPAEGLIELARDAAAIVDEDVTFLVGSAERLPVPDAVADVALSVFGVIFADDPAVALAEARRVTRSGGTVAITTWRPTGAIAATGKALMSRMPKGEGPMPEWGNDHWVEEALLSAQLHDVEIAESTLAFRSDSPDAFLADLESDHPAWRAVIRTLSSEERGALHEEARVALHEGNEDPGKFLTTSTYALVRARVP